MADDNNNLLAGGLIAAALLAGKKKRAPDTETVTVVNPAVLQILGYSTVDVDVLGSVLADGGLGQSVDSESTLDLSVFDGETPAAADHALVFLSEEYILGSGIKHLTPRLQHAMLLNPGSGWPVINIDVVREGPADPIAVPVTHRFRYLVYWVNRSGAVNVLAP